MTTTNPRWCFAVFEWQRNEHGFVPSIVTEDEPGHAPLVGRGELAQPYYWGDTIDVARKTCDRANAKIGISPEVAEHIVASSIATQTRLDARKAEATERLRQLGLD